MIINSYRFAEAAGFLLDVYTGAASAHSYQRLKSTFDTVIRIRRDNDDAETDVDLDGNIITLSSDVSAGGNLGTWVGSNNATVVKLYDHSGNGKDDVQTTGTRQPLFISSGTIVVDNSFPASSYIASSAQFTTHTESFGSGGDLGVFTVFNPSSTVAEAIWGNVDMTEQLIHFVKGSGNNIVLRAYDGANSDVEATSVAVQQQTSALIVSNSFQRLYRDGTLLDEDLTFGTMSAIASNLVGLGTYSPDSPSTNENFTGKIQERVIWKTDQSANRLGIEANQKARYNTP